MRLEPLKNKNTARNGEWDRQAGCWPSPGTYLRTFSIGIFQWVPASKGMKKGKTVRRIVGVATHPQEALSRANTIVADRNSRAKGANPSGPTKLK